jgi:hypothetical protein
VNAMLRLVERWVLVDLPHLKVVDFFYHRLPEPNPRINKPVRDLHNHLPTVKYFSNKRAG